MAQGSGESENRQAGRSGRGACVDCVIIGAGMAGLTAARALQAEGLSTCVLEKSRGVGGRMATRRIDGSSFDHGAQFFTAREEPFAQQLREWLGQNLVAPWFGDTGHERYKGLPTMNAVAKQLGHGLDIRHEQQASSVQHDGTRWRVSCEGGHEHVGKTLLITCPAPQALAILSASSLPLESSIFSPLQAVRYRKCIALLLLLEEPSGMKPPGFLKLGEPEPIATIADCQLKGTSHRPGLVVHSGYGFAEARYEEDSDTIADDLLQALRSVLPVRIRERHVRKWRFAHRSSPATEAFFLQSRALPLWLAGDSFGPPRVEGAFLSGRLAAHSILARLKSNYAANA